MEAAGATLAERDAAVAKLSGKVAKSRKAAKRAKKEKATLRTELEEARRQLIVAPAPAPPIDFTKVLAAEFEKSHYNDT